MTPSTKPAPAVGTIAASVKAIASALGDPRQKLTFQNAETLRRAANLLLTQRAEIRRLRRRLEKIEADALTTPTPDS